MNIQKFITGALLAFALITLPNLANAAGTYDGQYEGLIRLKFEGEVTRVFARMIVTDNKPVVRFYESTEDGPGEPYRQFSVIGFIDNKGSVYGVLVDDLTQEIVSGFGGHFAGKNNKNLLGRFFQKDYSHSFKFKEVE